MVIWKFLLTKRYDPPKEQNRHSFFSFFIVPMKGEWEQAQVQDRLWLCAFLCVRLCVCLCVCICICFRVCVWICICVCVCVCVCTCVCIYVKLRAGVRMDWGGNGSFPCFVHSLLSLPFTGCLLETSKNQLVESSKLKHHITIHHT